mgnify:CR=1 FL=1
MAGPSPHTLSAGPAGLLSQGNTPHWHTELSMKYSVLGSGHSCDGFVPLCSHPGATLPINQKGGEKSPRSALKQQRCEPPELGTFLPIPKTQVYKVLQHTKSISKNNNRKKAVSILGSHCNPTPSSPVAGLESWPPCTIPVDAHGPCAPSQCSESLRATEQG